MNNYNNNNNGNPYGPKPMGQPQQQPGMAPRPMGQQPQPGMAPRPMGQPQQQQPRPMNQQPGMAPRPMGQQPQPGMAPRPMGQPQPGMAPRPMGQQPQPGMAPRPMGQPVPRNVGMSTNTGEFPTMTRTAEETYIENTNVNNVNPFSPTKPQATDNATIAQTAILNIKRRYKVANVTKGQRNTVFASIAVTWLIAIALTVLTILAPLLWGSFASAPISTTATIMGTTYNVENYFQVNQLVFWLLPLLSGLWIAGSTYVTFNGLRFNRGMMSQEKLRNFIMITSVFSLFTTTAFLITHTKEMDLRDNTPRYKTRTSAIAAILVIMLLVVVLYGLVLVISYRTTTSSAVIINNGVLSGVASPYTYTYSSTFSKESYTVWMVIMLASTFLFISFISFLTSLSSGHIHLLIDPKSLKEGIDKISSDIGA